MGVEEICSRQHHAWPPSYRAAPKNWLLGRRAPAVPSPPLLFTRPLPLSVFSLFFPFFSSLDLEFWGWNLEDLLLILNGKGDPNPPCALSIWFTIFLWEISCYCGLFKYTFRNSLGASFCFTMLFPSLKVLHQYDGQPVGPFGHAIELGPAAVPCQPKEPNWLGCPR